VSELPIVPPRIPPATRKPPDASSDNNDTAGHSLTSRLCRVSLLLRAAPVDSLHVCRLELDQLIMTADGDLVENSLHGISPILIEVNDKYGDAYIGRGNASAVNDNDYSVSGTLVGSDVVWLWHGGTAGHPGARAVLQADGNFVIYSPSNAVLWSTGTAGHPGAKLAVQSDANVVVYDGSG
jgi:hypothetical protein